MATPELCFQSNEKIAVKRLDKRFYFDYSLPENNKNSYVYFVISNRELIYVGKGKADRWQHSVNGESHNIFVNRYNKWYGNKCYLIANDLTNKKAEYIESKWIKILKPIANIDGNPMYMKWNKGAQKLTDNFQRIIGFGDKELSKKTRKKCNKRNKNRRRKQRAMV
mgnify:CR=1 FL=1